MEHRDFTNKAKRILDTYEKTKCGVMTKAFAQCDNASPFAEFEITQNGSKINTMPLGEFLYELFRYVEKEEADYRKEIKRLEHDIEIRKEIRKELEAKIKKLNQPRMIKQMVVRSYQSINSNGSYEKVLAQCLNDGWKVVCSNYVPVYGNSSITCPAYIEYILEKEIEDEQPTKSETF